MVRRWITITNGGNEKERTVKEFRLVSRDFHGEYIVVRKKALSRKIHKSVQKRHNDRVYLDKNNHAKVRAR
jgi:hypothetical protein